MNERPETLEARVGAAPRSPIPDPRSPSIGHWLRRDAYRLVLPLVVASDAVLIAGVFLACYAARFQWGWITPAPAPAFGPYLHASVLVAIVWTAALVLVGLYHEKRGASRFDDFVLMAWGITLGAIATLALSFFYRSFSYSRLVYAYAFLGAIASLGGWHLLLRAWQEAAMKRGWGTLTTLILGHNSLSAMVASRLANPRLGRSVLGVVALPGDPDLTPQPVPVLGAESELPALMAAHEVDEVIIAWPASSPQQLFGLMQAVTLMRPVSVQVAPGMMEMMTAHLEVSSLDGLPMLAIREVKLRKGYYRFIKRLMDMTLSAAGLVALSPLLFAIAIAVKLDSPGPVLYTQERLGRDGRHFTIYKYRSMPLSAEPDGPIWASVGDDRATPVGSFLRRYSLDELPQLINVLRGDMSLVGPRPERPFFVDQFKRHVPKYMDRHLVRSGLTGWAQVNGLRGDVDIEERTRYDIYYVENWSVLLDLRIMLKTVLAIFRQPGY